MNAVRREQHYEVEVGNIEATDAKVDALKESLDEVKQDVRELRADVKAIRGEMHAGFTALRENLAELQATVKTWLSVIGVCATLALIFFSAGRALHWFEYSARPQGSEEARVVGEPHHRENDHLE